MRDYTGMTLEELAREPTVFRDDLLVGRTAVITGGGSGMGRAMAMLFARLGANVVICGRREEKLAEVRNGIHALAGREITYKPLTIRDPDSVEAFMDETFRSFGPIDVLINSAGGQFSQDAIDFSRKGWLA
ncbi:MAG: SDR family NAD(P)-dependent oxidoreductase, partial [Caulobacterales bacterium]|nr:SDR family NAD(P)-dependent oxidoreductase [Caulobacterales bacterium]